MASSLSAQRRRVRIVEHDEIDIAGIVELEGAHLAHGEHDVAAALLRLRRIGGLEPAARARPRAAESAPRRRPAVSATSVSARVARITGQTPPISANAMSSAASAFIRRSSRIASASSLVAATALPAFASNSARCSSGSELSSDSSRSGSAAARSQRYGEPSARPSSRASTFGAAAIRRFSALPAALSPDLRQPFGDAACAALRSVSRGASVSAERQRLCRLFAAAWCFFRGGPGHALS